MTDAQLDRLRRTALASTQGSTLDRAWRALERRGDIVNRGRGTASYTAIYEITAQGRAALASRRAA